MKFGFIELGEEEPRLNDIDNIDFNDLNEFAQKYIRIITKVLEIKYFVEFKHKFVDKNKRYGDNIEIISVTAYEKKWFRKGKTIGTYKLFLKDVGTHKYKVEGSEYLGNSTELIDKLNKELNEKGFTTQVTITSY